MYVFKKQFENESIIYKGRLFNKKNLKDSIVIDIIKNVPSLSNRFEKLENPIMKIKEPIKKIKVKKNK
jgi:hypothetical protein